MTERLLLQPPEITKVEGSVIFLAGPIQGAPEWQHVAAGIIHALNSGLIVASPRKQYVKGEFAYEKQVDWETHFLNRAAKAGGIMFWLAAQVEETPGRAYAQTSRFELGEWKARQEQAGIKLVVGIEEGFGNERYIRRRLGQDCPSVPILSSLRDTCETIVELVDSPSD